MAVLPIGMSGEQAGGYQIERSLRFNSADSAYLSRTPASAGNRRTFTLSFWIKSGSLAAGTTGQIMGTTVGTYDRINFGENSTAQLSFTVDAAGTAKTCLTPGVYRDPSAWYHFVVAVDTTQATDTNRVKIYANGVQQTLTGTFPTQNYQSSINNNVAQYLGSDRGSTYFLSGYLTEVHFIDGSALAPTSFGEYNTDTSVWQPKAYTGSYGTNGFYLDFADNSSTTALGYDAAGSNDWTPNNFSVTAGAGNDSLVDTPTPYGTDTGAGGQVRGNYCTLNPTLGGSAGSFANGNLDATLSSTTGSAVFAGTMAMPTSGKYYFEYTVNTATSDVHSVGIVSAALVTKGTMSNDSNAEYATSVIYRSNGTIYKNTSSQGSFTSMSNGDIIGVAYSADAAEVKFYRNGTLITTVTGVTAVDYLPHAAKNPTGGSYSASFVFNAGQRPFAYTAPSGFKALCTQNLPEPTVVDGGEYFNTVIYAGSASQQVIDSNLSALDLAWIKNRTTARDHVLVDTVRGGSPMLTLYPNQTYAEDNTSPNFNPTSISGGSITLGGAKLGINNAGENFVMWGWKANGTGVSNTAGTITSTVSANTTAGFSVATMTGNGSVFTFGHGLGVAPAMVIVKYRSGTAPNIAGWAVYHKSLTSAAYRIDLNATSGQISDINAWNSTAPTSTVVTVGTNLSVNNTPLVAYCFAPVAGYSAFGSYTGNGSTDGPFVYTGFRPRWIMFKRADGVSTWEIVDTSRSTYNVIAGVLQASSSAAEASTGDYANLCDATANGFKIRSTSSASNSGTVIYAAFAENPFKFSLAR